ncbi:emopamil binding protein [Zalerion maritima]|uniref:Emopamil binding protein n=1 Tax=Zalerion maritima TaxID=339359 RepID=A0AAD5WSC1_9PEZI|nr:emopamil binding protein [Zalerion maritima]
MDNSSHVASELPLSPYYPLGVAVPGYVANDMTTLTILSYFAVGCGSILLAACFISRRVRPSLSTGELLTVMWFVLSGSIHLGMEGMSHIRSLPFPPPILTLHNHIGYVVYHSAAIGSMQTVLGQAWKEYSHSDSRYLTQDPFVITMEGITAVFWGPLCLVIAYCILADHPMRHPLQTIVSLGQIYGDVLYYLTCWFDHSVREIVYCRPENFYFWGYFILLNAFWIVIPFHLMTTSMRETSRAFDMLKVMVDGKKMA